MNNKQQKDVWLGEDEKLLNHDEEAQNKNFKTATFQLYPPSRVSLISLFDTICVSCSTHKKTRKTRQERRSVFCLPVQLEMSSSVLSLSMTDTPIP